MAKNDPEGAMTAARALAPRKPLAVLRMPRPALREGKVLVKVAACGVCRTDLHIADGELAQCRYPVTPGHEIVGYIVQGGTRFARGARIGIPWLAWTCGECEYCGSGRENLCDGARFIGCHVDGGYAEYVAADERY